MTDKTTLTPTDPTRPRYYSLRCYPPSGFPKFIDSFKTLALAHTWATQALKDGYTTVEILHELPQKPGSLGVDRQIIEILT